MREKNFTPGPWSVDGRITNGVEGFEIHWSADGECVTDHVYTLPDANLIAAAPVMLKELEKICAACARLCGREPEECEECSANAAIKKAYGETE